MNQKQYHSLEELPLMMNMTDVAAVLAFPEPELTSSPTVQISERFRSARAHRCLAGKNFLGWLDRQSTEQKCAWAQKSTSYFTVFVVVIGELPEKEEFT